MKRCSPFYHEGQTSKTTEVPKKMAVTEGQPGFSVTTRREKKLFTLFTIKIGYDCVFCEERVPDFSSLTSQSPESAVLEMPVKAKMTTASRRHI